MNFGGRPVCGRAWVSRPQVAIPISGGRATADCRTCTPPFRGDPGVPEAGSVGKDQAHFFSNSITEDDKVGRYPGCGQAASSHHSSR